MEIETLKNISCYDKETQIYTEHGWVKFYDLLRLGKTKVAQVTPDKKIELVNYSDFIEITVPFTVKEQLLHFKKDYVLDLKVTSEQKMVIEEDGILKLVKADQIKEETICRLDPNYSVSYHRVFPKIHILKDLFNSHWDHSKINEYLNSVTLENVKIDKVFYVGPMYSVSVPSGMILVRRYGQPIVCGAQ